MTVGTPEESHGNLWLFSEPHCCTSRNGGDINDSFQEALLHGGEGDSGGMCLHCAFHALYLSKIYFLR